jgi:hypothetical protein
MEERFFIRTSGMEYRSWFDVGLGRAGIKSVHSVACKLAAK